MRQDTHVKLSVVTFLVDVISRPLPGLAGYTHVQWVKPSGNVGPQLFVSKEFPTKMVTEVKSPPGKITHLLSQGPPQAQPHTDDRPHELVC